MGDAVNPRRGGFAQRSAWPCRARGTNYGLGTSAATRSAAQILRVAASRVERNEVPLDCKDSRQQIRHHLRVRHVRVRQRVVASFVGEGQLEMIQAKCLK